MGPRLPSGARILSPERQPSPGRKSRVHSAIREAGACYPPGGVNATNAPERPGPRPWAYFLTFACYGARLHGDPRGSVDDRHSVPFTRYLPANPARVAHETGLMPEAAVTLNSVERWTTLAAFQQTCRLNAWDLHAAHVRTNHAHLVLTAEREPERVMAKLKAYATRSLNERYGPKKRRWAAHGSTRWLWDVHQTVIAAHYVIAGQGERMALYVSSPSWLPRGYRQ